MHDVVSLTVDLCEIPSITLTEADVVSRIGELARNLGVSARTQQVGDVIGRQNILLTSTATAPIDILMTTHIDTVPPFLPPKRVGDRLMGRGVIDAKGIAAAMVCAWERLLLSRSGVGERRGLRTGRQTLHQRRAHRRQALPRDEGRACV
jgi:acetylornithine deacetylase